MFKSTLVYVKISFVISIFTYCSLLDLKYREIPDEIWLICYPLAFLFLAYDLILGLVPLFKLLFFTLLSIVIVLVPAYIGLYGGGDAKALILLALTMPIYPPDLTPFLRYTTPMVVLTCLDNGNLLALTSSLCVLVKNVKARLQGSKPFSELEDLGFVKKLLLYLTCYKASYEEFKAKSYLYPAETIEEVDGRPVRRAKLTVRLRYERSHILDTVKRNPELYGDGIYVSIGIPLIFFLTLGFILSLIGDLLLSPVLSVLLGVKGNL